MESDFFASGPTLTLMQVRGSFLCPTLLSNLGTSTFTLADDIPGSVQPCSFLNVSPAAKAVQ